MKEDMKDVSVYAGRYARRLERLLLHQAEHHQQGNMFLTGVWVSKEYQQKVISVLKGRRQALMFLVHIGSILLVLIMLAFWYGFSWFFLP